MQTLKELTRQIWSRKIYSSFQKANDENENTQTDTFICM